jgi:hypothetical protein
MFIKRARRHALVAMQATNPLFMSDLLFELCMFLAVIAVIGCEV